MAKAKRSDGVPSSVQLIPVPVTIDVRLDTPFYYSNYMSVSHTAYEFTITVARVPSPLTPDQMASARKGEKLNIDATLQIIAGPRIMKGLIDALTDQLSKYESNFGKVITEVKEDGKG